MPHVMCFTRAPAFSTSYMYTRAYDRLPVRYSANPPVPCRQHSHVFIPGMDEPWYGIFHMLTPFNLVMDFAHDSAIIRI